MTAISRHPDVLNLRRFGVFAFQVWSHKVMRWLVPWFLLSLLLVNLLLARQHWLYMLTLLAQAACYGLAVVAHFVEPLKQNSLVRIVYFFVYVNIAVADAGCRFLRGQRMTTWQPSTR
jgi:hypothetical protein